MSYGFGRTYSVPATTATVEVEAPAPRRRNAGNGNGNGDSANGAGSASGPITLDARIEVPSTGPIYFAVGGGLSPSRIVKKLDSSIDVAQGTLQGLVDYALTHLDNDEERMIAATVRQRSEKPDYMVSVNRTRAQDHRYLSTLVQNAMTARRHGEASVPFVDIAVLSAEEGGYEPRSGAGVCQGGVGQRMKDSPAIAPSLEKVIGGYRR